MNDDVKIYFQKAKDCLSDSQYLFEGNRFESSVNRSYYAFFDAIRALLISKSIFTKTHSGNHNAFREHFIKTKIFPIEMNNALNELFDKRQGGDYEADIFIEKIDADESLKKAAEFINLVEIYLKKEYFI
jgi:uncharacterized protein (UPF0332 family)